MDKIEKVSVNGQVYELAGSGGASAPTSITYSELKALVESSGLQAGARYRITDYVTSFKTWESAGHPFDIVVTALDAGTLLAEAVAMPHEEDEYFANNDLTAWKLFYDINNDTAKYVEAKEDGKGFIYSMTDEYGNKANYDFKNALRRVTSDVCDVVTESEGLAFYTFSKMDSGRNITDFSLSKKCYDNEVYVSYAWPLPSICYKPIIGELEMHHNKIYSKCFILTQVTPCQKNEIYEEVITASIINSFSGNLVHNKLRLLDSASQTNSISFGANIKEIIIKGNVHGHLVRNDSDDNQIIYSDTYVLRKEIGNLTSASSSEEIQQALNDTSFMTEYIDLFKKSKHIVLPIEQDGLTITCYPFFTAYKDTEEEAIIQFASYVITFQITYNKSSKTYSYS